MAARRLQNVADLMASPDERVELIDGEIVRWPIANGEHGMAQGNTREVIGPLQRKDGSGGWWIATRSALPMMRTSARAMIWRAGARNGCPGVPAAWWG